jgi:nucleotide-binding universal stress UspA family protein
MQGVILTVLDDPALAPGLLAAAGSLARLGGSATVNALAVRMPPEASIMPTEEVLTQHDETRIRARETARAAALHQAFAAWSPGAGIAAEWIDTQGLARLAVDAFGRRADAIVIARPRPHDHLAAREELSGALFDTDRPVLAVPPGFAPDGGFGRRVAIAWRDDAHATRAVLSLLRLVPAPERVLVFAGIRPGAPAPALPAILTEHGVAADLHVLTIGASPFGATLLEAARALGADLLAMGAYAHSPLREWLLGGMTRHMLLHADLPLLLRH